MGNITINFLLDYRGVESYDGEMHKENNNAVCTARYGFNHTEHDPRMDINPSARSKKVTTAVRFTPAIACFQWSGKNNARALHGKDFAPAEFHYRVSARLLSLVH